nr:MAG TPA: hypothetical protein [Caudoviricetes sp.]
MLAALVALGVMCWLLVQAGTGALIPLILTLAVVPLGTLANMPNQPDPRRNRRV